MRQFIALIVLSILAAGSCLTGAAKVSITYAENAQIELMSPGGVRVLIDVHDPSRLSAPAGKDDILLTTHTHADHYQAAYCDAFPGQQLRVKAGELKAGDVAIKGIASAHQSYFPLQPENGSNYIFLIETGGLRIVHFGDIGQDALSQEQLAAIGRVDVAVMQIANSFSSMSILNKKGFNLMDQAKPRLIILTHLDLETVKHAAGIWDGYGAAGRSISLDAETLPAKTSYLIMGDNAPIFAKVVKLTEAPW